MKRLLTAWLLVCILCTSASAEVYYTLDFEYAKAAVPAISAWLFEPEEIINQAVLTGDGDFEKRDFMGKRSSGGSLRLLPDAKTTVIVGANRSDGSMFGFLSKYRKASYYEKHRVLYLILPEGTYRLDVFAAEKLRLSDAELAAFDPAKQADDVLARSFLKAPDYVLPEAGDEWVVLATSAKNGKAASRYVLYTRKRPLAKEDWTAYVNQLWMDRRSTKNGVIDLTDVGIFRTYAQNDSSWGRLLFEAEGSKKRRPFEDGGCGPTAVAMALANLLTGEQLTRLTAYAADPLGFRFCSCSVNTLFCTRAHLPYQMSTGEDFERYLPLAVASFAAGNNTFGVKGRTPNGYGTSMDYLPQLCEALGLSFRAALDLDDAIAFLQSGSGLCVACASLRHNLFSSASHYVTLAAANEDYLYILDPSRHKNYLKTDEEELLEVLAPGVVRIALKDAEQCGFTPIYLLGQDNQR